MKKRIISFLLCMALLIGVMPTGLFTLTASAENSGVITNVVVEYTDDLSVKVTFNGFPGVFSYKIYVVDENLKIGGFSNRIDLEEFPVSSESENSGRISCVLTKLKELTDKGEFFDDDRGEYYVSVHGCNKYNDEICVSDNVMLASPRKADATGIPRTQLPAPGAPYFFGDGSVALGNGMVGFESVDFAAYYEVTLSYNGTTLAKKKVTDSYADFSDVLEEGMLSEYRIEVVAYSYYSDGPYSLPSSSHAFETYKKSHELKGGAHITKDKKIVLSGQLAYLNDYYGTIYSSWETVENGEWRLITDAEKNNYDYSMLRVKFMAAGLSGSFETEDLVGTNPACPMVITDSDFFFKELYSQVYQKGKLYVKLGADITNHSGNKLVTAQRGISLGGDNFLDLDLAGYTLSFRNVNPENGVLFCALEDARIIIRDSRRYDEKAKKWRDGQVRFSSQWNDYTDTVLMGNITLESGEIIHEGHYAGERRHTGYHGKTLIMNGGLIQADYPIYYINDKYVKTDFYGSVYIYDECGYLYEKWKYGISAGELITTEGPVLSLYCDTNQFNYAFWRGIFPVSNCRFSNGTGKSTATSVQCRFPSDVTEETKSDAVKTILNFFPETATHNVGGAVNYQLTDTDFSIVDVSEVTYEQNYALSGPTFTVGHIISTPTEITLKNLDFHIAWPKPGEKPSYLLVGEESTYYTYTISWRKQIATNVYKEMDFSETFESGKTYEAVITLHPRDGFSFKRNNTSQVTTVNGEEAFWNYSNNSFTLRLLPRDTYYNVWVGGVRVGDGNKNDVLGDGGSVKFYKKGELPKLSDSDVSGKYSDTLILNNFTMPKDCYKTGVSNPAQLYIDEDLNIVLRGNNTFDSNSIVDGIYADCRQLWFYGNGSLNIDVRNHDKTAINCPGSQISLFENVSVTAKGARGIYDPWDGDGENGVYVCDNTSLSCYACQTDDGHDHPALEGSYVDVYSNGRLTCETQYDGEAIASWAEDYPNSYADVKVLRQGEYVRDGITPYTPEKGLNVTGGVHERDCRYIYIGPKTSSGVTLSGTVTSFGSASDKITISLYEAGQSTPAYTTQVTGNSANYSISGVAAGTYTMTVSKTKHATREYTITVNGNLTQNAEIRLYGDITGDGDIGSADATQINRYYNGKTSMFTAESLSENDRAYLLKVGNIVILNDPTHTEIGSADATQINRYYNGKTSMLSQIP